MAAAAHDAFESAIYAAAAAKAAVELSRSESQDNDSDDEAGYSHQPRAVSNSDRLLTPNLKSDEYAAIKEDEDSNSIDNFVLDSEGEDMTEINTEIHLKEVEESEVGGGKTLYASSSDSDNDILSTKIQFSGLQSRNEQVRNKVASDDVDNDSVKNQGNIPWKKHDDLDFNRKPSLPCTQHQHNSEYNQVDEHYRSDEDIDNEHHLRISDSLKLADDPRKTKMTSTKGFRELLHSQHSSIDWKPLSMRTRGVQKV